MPLQCLAPATPVREAARPRQGGRTSPRARAVRRPRACLAGTIARPDGPSHGGSCSGRKGSASHPPEVPVPDASGPRRTVGPAPGRRQLVGDPSRPRLDRGDVADVTALSVAEDHPSGPPFAPSSGQSPHAVCRRRRRQSPPRRTRRDRSPGPWPRPPAPGTRAGRERRRGRSPAARSAGRRRRTVAAGSPGTSPRATDRCDLAPRGLLPRGSLRASDRAVARGSFRGWEGALSAQARTGPCGQASPSVCCGTTTTGQAEWCSSP